jgi:peptidoglycan/xylan/chitin deacetylase (PgdA/CDA1 family)
MLASVWYAGLRALGITTLARHLRNAGVILCYHNVVATGDGHDAGDPGLHIPRSTFERQMRWLAANCELVSLSEFVDRVERRASVRRLGAVTFDDGYAGVFEHAWPLLHALSIPATVFLVATAPGRSNGFWWDHPIVRRAATPGRRREWLIELRGDGAAILDSLAPHAPLTSLPASHLAADWKAIAWAVASGMTVGVHSATHRSLPTLDDTELRYEVITSHEVIARETGVSPEFFAYPYGLWDQRVRRVVHAAGYRAGLTLDHGLNPAGADSWTLRRVNMPASIHDSAFQAWVSGLSLRKSGS